MDGTNTNGQQHPYYSKKKRKRNKKKPQAAQKQQSTQGVDSHAHETGHQHHKNTLPPIHIPRVHEPHPTCDICGKPVQFIAEALSPSEDKFCHFDCVLEKLKAEERPGPGEMISYIGRGTFAVVTASDDGKEFTIVRRIPYETPESYAGIKKYVEGMKK